MPSLHSSVLAKLLKLRERSTSAPPLLIDKFVRGLANSIIALAIGTVLMCAIVGDDWPARADADKKTASPKHL